MRLRGPEGWFAGFSASCQVVTVYARKKENSMRIGVNARLLIDGRMEGVGWYAHEVISRLVAMFPDIEFVLFFDRQPDPRFVYASNVRAVVLSPQARHPLLYLAWFEGALPAAMRAHEVDLFFSPEPFMSLRSDVPAVITVHDIAYVHFPQYISALTGLFYRVFFHRYMRKARQIVSVSGYTTEDVVEHYSISRDKFVQAGNGCRNSFAPLGESERQALRDRWAGGNPYFCYLGSIHPRKNTLHLIKAFEKMKVDTGCPHHLILAGRWGWKQKAVARALRQSPFRDAITLTGYLPEPEPARILAASDGLVYPSLFEGFGLPVLEAMHAEVPILTSSVSSMPEVAGEAAILVDPHSVDSIAAGMKQLVTDPELRHRLVAAGCRERMRYSWDLTAKVTARALGLIPQ